MIKRLLQLHPNEIFVKLFVILLAGLGLVRSLNWISARTETLKHVSDLYVKMSKYMDIDTVGWLLFLFSIVLFLSAFFDNTTGYILLIVGSVPCGIIHIAFGMISVESANVSSTYYINMLIGFIQILVAINGAFSIWKIKNL
ncbi:hypothetical protein KS414_11265 [Staphylococcus capitis]|uniref:hypothetical protein n=1 Tax=Staphylococcus TaxID=1279 RepID=UPI00021A28C8|nr:MULTISPECIES: hypothetical protein [Staphylococcus]EGS40309.1 hypothetical protein SEVCU116_1772 [Staphylococcus capitis VCU116]MCC0830957.1 hypothetical protein [Staphylococcus capitis]MCI2955648.1 hypothetical protein [Staphylococcus caprae]